MRLNKYLASIGVASRRKIDELIAAGRVRVNGKIAQLGQLISEKDAIEVDGKKISTGARLVYLMLNKPEKVVSTLVDPEGRKTVADLVKVEERVYPVGRLDYETTGLLLLTNDGELAFRLTHPKYEVKKRYHLLVGDEVSESKLQNIRRGVVLSDGLTAPAEARVLESRGGASVLELVIHEGKKREIRRICEALEIPLLELKRVAVDGVVLSDLPVGKYRTLTKEEIAQLKKEVGLV